MSSERQAPLASCVTFCSALVPRGGTTRKRVRNQEEFANLWRMLRDDSEAGAILHMQGGLVSET
jgi:hypothetical protein